MQLGEFLFSLMTKFETNNLEIWSRWIAPSLTNFTYSE